MKLKIATILFIIIMIIIMFVLFPFKEDKINDPSPSLFKQSLSHYQLYLGDIYFTKNDKNKAQVLFIICL
ncbi:hypothetical protein AB6H17_12025 [Proteus vulgaris]|uniref:hypothetical protein n=1 Tax=Proteus vulgaris TaxID=585 RepID=UPI0034DD3E49